MAKAHNQLTSPLTAQSSIEWLLAPASCIIDDQTKLESWLKFNDQDYSETHLKTQFICLEGQGHLRGKSDSNMIWESYASVHSFLIYDKPQAVEKMLNAKAKSEFPNGLIKIDWDANIYPPGYEYSALFSNRYLDGIQVEPVTYRLLPELHVPHPEIALVLELTPSLKITEINNYSDEDGNRTIRFSSETWLKKHHLGQKGASDYLPIILLEIKASSLGRFLSVKKACMILELLLERRLYSSDKQPISDWEFLGDLAYKRVWQSVTPFPRKPNVVVGVLKQLLIIQPESIAGTEKTITPVDFAALLPGTRTQMSLIQGHDYVYLLFDAAVLRRYADDPQYELEMDSGPIGHLSGPGISSIPIDRRDDGLIGAWIFDLDEKLSSRHKHYWLSYQRPELLRPSQDFWNTQMELSFETSSSILQEFKKAIRSINEVCPEALFRIDDDFKFQFDRLRLVFEDTEEELLTQAQLLSSILHDSLNTRLIESLLTSGGGSLTKEEKELGSRKKLEKLLARDARQEDIDAKLKCWVIAYEIANFNRHGTRTKWDEAWALAQIDPLDVGYRNAYYGLVKDLSESLEWLMAQMKTAFS